MMRRLTSLASAVVFLLAVTAAHAADTKADTKAQAAAVSGTVVSSTASSLVIKTDKGDQQTFVVDAGTQVPESLAAGAKVTVEFQAMADGRMQAKRVTVSKGAA